MEIERRILKAHHKASFAPLRNAAARMMAQTDADMQHPYQGIIDRIDAAEPDADGTVEIELFGGMLEVARVAMLAYAQLLSQKNEQEHRQLSRIRDRLALDRKLYVQHYGTPYIDDEEV